MMKKLPLLLGFGLFACSLWQAQAASLSQAEQRETIDTLNTLLAENYLFPDVAQAMSERLLSSMKDGDYENIKDTQAFAQRLTKDLQSVSHDKHLRVIPDSEGKAQAKSSDPAAQEAFQQAQVRFAKFQNYGFEEVKIIDGNIGYLKLNKFSDASVAGDTAVAAMNFFANADALIIDLRYNGGGSPSMIQLLTSYLFDSEPVHLNNFYWRPSDTRTQTWTLPHVPGVRRPNMPVYVLTSKSTFSAAEEFSYNLRNLERAILVGETTGGGAHPGGTQRVSGEFVVWMPQGRAINPITNTNWEGSGVKPHMETAAADALMVAHKDALNKLLAAHPGEEGFLYRWHLQGLTAKTQAYEVDRDLLASYTGQFGSRTLSYEDGELFYQRKGRGKHKLLAMSSNTFIVEDVPQLRLELVTKKGKVTALKAHYHNGRIDVNAKRRIGSIKRIPQVR